MYAFRRQLTVLYSSPEDDRTDTKKDDSSVDPQVSIDGDDERKGREHEKTRNEKKGDGNYVCNEKPFSPGDVTSSEVDPDHPGNTANVSYSRLRGE